MHIAENSPIRALSFDEAQKIAGHTLSLSTASKVKDYLDTLIADKI